MSYSIEQLPNQRWGIYAQKKLLATFGSRETCLKVLNLLQTKMILIGKRNQVMAQLQKQAA